MSNKSTVLLEHHLKELKLPTFLKEYDRVASRCAAEGVDHPDYLLRLSELELIDRNHRMVGRRIKAARFPATKSLDTFDFLAIPCSTKPWCWSWHDASTSTARITSSLLATAAPARPTSPSDSAWLRVREGCPWDSPRPPLWSTS